MSRRRGPHRLLRHAFVGGVAGIAASWAMTRFAIAWMATADTGARHRRKACAIREWEPRTQDDRATALIARTVAERMVGVDLTSRQLRVIVPLVRYGYGAAAGVLYSLLAEAFTGGIAAGAAWGAMLWAVGDELIVPALERARGHVATDHGNGQALAAHLVYGLTADTVSRALRRLMPA